MKNMLTNLSNTTKGILLILTGSILLLNTLGIMEKSLDTVIIIASLAMIGAGIFTSGAHQKLYALITKKNNNKKEQ